MLNRIGSTLRVGVAGNALALVRTSMFAAPVVLGEVPLSDRSADFLAGGLRSLLSDASLRGQPVSFVIADELARMWTVKPPQGASRLADLEAAARYRFQTLFGEAPTGWRIGADWHPAEPFLAVSLHGDLLASIEGRAAANRMVVMSIAPQLVVAWNAIRAKVNPGTWFGSIHDDVLTVGIPARGRLNTVRTTVLPPVASTDWLDAHLEREALLLGIDPPKSLMACGSAPASWKGDSGRVMYKTVDAPVLTGFSAAAQLAMTGAAR